MTDDTLRGIIYDALRKQDRVWTSASANGAKDVHTMKTRLDALEILLIKWGTQSPEFTHGHVKWQTLRIEQRWLAAMVTSGDKRLDAIIEVVAWTRSQVKSIDAILTDISDVLQGDLYPADHHLQTIYSAHMFYSGLKAAHQMMLHHFRLEAEDADNVVKWRGEYRDAKAEADRWQRILEGLEHALEAVSNDKKHGWWDSADKIDEMEMAIAEVRDEFENWSNEVTRVLNNITRTLKYYKVTANDQ